MQRIDSFKDLVVWQRSIQLTVALYQLTTAFPPDERFGLTNQLRRAGVSVSSNIAEGYGRLTTGEYRQFLGMARGSNAEVQTQLVIARELGLGIPEHLARAEKLSEEVARMLVSLLQKLS
jgi:four helix bundle protein